jgi:CRP-like cAMP-binding protein
MDVQAVGEFLRTVRPLGRFAYTELAPLAARMRERRLRAGQVLAKEGARGTEMYFIRRGTLAIVKGVTGGIEQVVARIGAGEFVGEMALFDRRPGKS